MSTNRYQQRSIVAVLVFIMVIAELGATAPVYAASKVGQVKGLKVVASSYNSVKISWKKVKGAKGYQIYRATSKNGRYKKIKTTKARTYKNHKLKTGTRYYYKVRAYRGPKKGKFSTKKSAVPKLAAPSSFTAASKSTSTIALSWKKVPGAKGYQIYRAVTKSGRYARIKTTSSAAFLDSGLEAERTYSYKIRAYRKVGKYTKYSSFTPVRSARTEAEVSVQPDKPTEPAKPPIEVKPPSLAIEEAKHLLAGNEYRLSIENQGDYYASDLQVEIGDTAICNYRRKTLYPVSRGTTTVTLFLVDHNGRKIKELDQETITVEKGVEVAFNGNVVEFGMPVSQLPEPTEKLETIYGYTDWLYANNYRDFYMVGVKDGRVVNVFTAAKEYKTNGNDSYTISRMDLDGSRSMENAAHTPVKRVGTTITTYAWFQNTGNAAAYKRWPQLDQAQRDLLLENMSKEVCHISNAIRVSYYDKEPLAMNPVLTSIANDYSRLQLQYHTSGHWVQDINERSKRYLDGGGCGYSENVGEVGLSGNDSLSAVIVENTMGSAGHRANMLSDQYTQQGVGIAANDTLTELYDTESFGER
ncbi:fibronectin type III domain-containing protein [Clostridiales Family XIII bacterium ASD5510]|uniref:Fibronectin type III domain-containing protein n=2 Tax=Bacteria TaxID=2 RepID=A0A9J6QNY0_9FIRM|nr:fibronectin type III domain-containing protein [Hominibacterium faecale]MCU7378897.1 fibronectin type III domain-containing protein [Hominibacterium faecale]